MKQHEIYLNTVNSLNSLFIKAVLAVLAVFINLVTLVVPSCPKPVVLKLLLSRPPLEAGKSESPSPSLRTTALKYARY